MVCAAVVLAARMRDMRIIGMVVSQLSPWRCRFPTPVNEELRNKPYLLLRILKWSRRQNIEFRCQHAG